MPTRDEMLKSKLFQARLDEADAHAQKHNLNSWATRIVWVALSEGVLLSRRYAMRRHSYQGSEAWAIYTRLLDLGVFSEDPEGIYYQEGLEPWESDPYLWMHTILKMGAGAVPPKDFPRKK